MIIVLQSVQSVYRGIQRKLDEQAGIVVTMDPNVVLERVQASVGLSEPTIVISSQVLHEGTFVTGTNLARVVKEIDPGAWFFIWSTMPKYSPHVDGFIEKSIDDMYRHAVGFLGDVAGFTSLEEALASPWVTT